MKLLQARAVTGLPPPYANSEAVNEELVDILVGPAEHEGAVDVFVSCAPCLALLGTVACHPELTWQTGVRILCLKPRSRACSAFMPASALV